MTKDEALKLAHEALEANYQLINGTDTNGGLVYCIDGYYSDCFDEDPINEQTEKAINAIKEALAQPEQTNIARHEANVQKFLGAPQPEQEPMAWPHKYGCRANAFGKCDMGCTTPPQPKPLTDEQLKPLIQKAMMYYGHNPDHWLVTAGAGFCILARAIEAAHGIKE